ncbi:MAG: hypothetical protein ACRC41_07985 [Sarcina sp.]
MANKKLDYKTRREILDLYIAGYSKKYIAKKFNLNSDYIGHIIHSKFTKLLDIQ